MSHNGNTFTIRGLDYFYQDRGQGPTVLFIHGFPDTHRVWRHQIEALVAQGYRVLAPDMRGFGATDMPSLTLGYGLPIMAADMVQLIEELGLERVHLVGHDFGAAIAWFMAILFPKKVQSLCALSVGYPANMLAPDFEQRKRSWFTYLFQFSPAAETLLRMNNWALFRELFPQQDALEDWIEQLERPGRLTAALDWYRINMHPANEIIANDITCFPGFTILEKLGILPNLGWHKVQANTLAIWGCKDPYMGRLQIEDSAQYVKGKWQFVAIEEAGHWLPLDVPQQINRYILGHLEENTGG